MKTRRFLAFSTSFDDEPLENDDGDIIRPGGENIISAIKNGVDFKCGDVSQHEFYGWVFSFELDPRCKARVILQQPDEWLLLLEVSSKWYLSKRTKDQFIQGAVKSINAALILDDRFFDVRWIDAPT